MVQVIFDFVLLARTREHVLGLRPEIGLAVRTAAKFQRYQVIQLVIVDAACDPINPHQPVFHRIGVLERRPDTRGIASPTDRVFNVALSNPWIDCSWRQVVTRQRSRRKVRLRWSALKMILANPRRTVQQCSVVGRVNTPRVLAYEGPVVPYQKGTKDEQ